MILTTAIQHALLQLGVPEDRIVMDYAGFSTLDSIVRAKKVFGLSGFCVITQRDHALRAIYIARANGIDVVGFPAKDVSMPPGLRTRFRESLARVRTFCGVTDNAEHMERSFETLRDRPFFDPLNSALCDGPMMPALFHAPRA